MLDEREGPVAPEERHRAFNTQPLRSRAAIVAAGPIANLLLAVLLYTAVNWMGVDEPVPCWPAPWPARSRKPRVCAAASASRVPGSTASLAPVQSFEDLRWLLTRGALDAQDLTLEVAGEDGRPSRQVVLPLSRIEAKDADRADVPQDRRGRSADTVRDRATSWPAAPPNARACARATWSVRVGRTPVVDGQQLRELIRTSGRTAASRACHLAGRARRANRSSSKVTPELREEAGATVGRIGAYVGAPPEMVTVRHGPVDGCLARHRAHLGGLGADRAHDGHAW
jgi:regulator of sigma E protease